MGSTKASVPRIELPKLANRKWQEEGCGISATPSQGAKPCLHMGFTAMNPFLELGK